MALTVLSGCASFGKWCDAARAVNCGWADVSMVQAAESGSRFGNAQAWIAAEHVVTAPKVSFHVLDLSTQIVLHELGLLQHTFYSLVFCGSTQDTGGCFLSGQVITQSKNFASKVL